MTHHEVADPMAVCTTDYPVVETMILLDDDLEPSVRYVARVNGETASSSWGDGFHAYPF